MTADCFLNGIILSLYHVRTVCEDFNSQAVFVFESKMMGRSSAYAVERWLLYADLYDSANFEAKKMVVNQLIRRVDVYRGYQINISFNFDLTPYIEGE